MANLIPKIAELLGVELGEEFKVVSKDGSERACKITYAGLLVSGSSYSKRLLVDIVCGDAEVVKLPWKPKFDEKYWSFMVRRDYTDKTTWSVAVSIWLDHPVDWALLDKGWVYRTRAETEAALPAVAKALGVKYDL